jgi:hypothetical protein
MLCVVSFNDITLQIFSTEGQFIQGCLIDTMKIMFPYKGKDFKMNFIRNTVTECMNGLTNKLKDD